MSDPPTLRAALALARRGFPVLQLAGKKPVTRHGLHDASRDLGLLRGWWECRPTANVGVRTGDGLLVVDVDRVAALAELPSFAPTVSARTGGGGLHLWYRGDGPSTTSKLAEGVDTRGRGGYVVAAPSRHPNGKAYAWASGGPIAPAPEWLLERLTDAREPRDARALAPRAWHGDELRSIPAVDYVPRLTGQPLVRGKVSCPWHSDSDPSLHCYPEPKRGWTCFGCGRGGSIIDFGAALYGVEPRGRGYHEVRRRLESELMARAA